MIDLFEQHRGAIADLCRKHHVRRLDVFGSASTGAFDPARSDIDLIADFDPAFDEPWIANRFRFEDELAELLGRKIDLLMKSKFDNPYFAQSVQESRKLLYAA